MTLPRGICVVPGQAVLQNVRQEITMCVYGFIRVQVFLQNKCFEVEVWGTRVILIDFCRTAVHGGCSSMYSHQQHR